MVEKENLTPGFRFGPLFGNLQTNEVVALMADTLLFLVIGLLALLAILTMWLDFSRSTSVLIVAIVALVAVLVFGLFIAAKKSIKHVKRDQGRQI